MSETFCEAANPPKTSPAGRPVKVLRRLRPAAAVLAWTLLIIASLWCFLAIWHFEPLAAWIRAPAALVWAISVPLAFVFLPRARAWRAAAVGVLVVVLAWSSRTPSNEQNWIRGQRHVPSAEFDGRTVRIRNFRHAVYRTEDHYEVRWHEKDYDLDAIRTVDFVVVPFASWRGPAHTFLTFGFEGGEQVAISVEARKEQGEAYSPLRGLFRQYEIVYVVGDERDLIGLRLNVRKNPVYLFPIRATKQQAQAMFVSMLHRANRLAGRPEFYNTATNNCCTNIARHLEEVTGRRLPFDLRVHVPGYSDRLALEMGLIDFDGSLVEARDRFLVRQVPPLVLDARAWSKSVRAR